MQVAKKSFMILGTTSSTSTTNRPFGFPHFAHLRPGKKFNSFKQKFSDFFFQFEKQNGLYAGKLDFIPLGALLFGGGR